MNMTIKQIRRWAAAVAAICLLTLFLPLYGMTAFAATARIAFSDPTASVGSEINVTSREFDLLKILVLNPNKVYSREELLNLVWGYEYPGDVRTVDVHIRRLREKIERNPSEPKYVFTKWEWDITIRHDSKTGS